MAAKSPLVMYGGQIAQLQAGDTLNASTNEVDVITASNSEASAITIGMPVYVFGSGTVKKAKADASGTMRVLGLVRTASVAASASGSIQTDGVLSSSDWTAVVGATTLTAGAVYYLSAATAGLLTATAPSATGQFVAAVGLAISTTDLEINIDMTVQL